MNEYIISIVLNIISSFLYEPVGKITDSVSNKVSKKRNSRKVSESIIKDVHKQLKEMQEKSRIFDSDSMQNYLKNMKPIEKIYKFFFQPGSAHGSMSDELIIKLTQDTKKYLDDCGKVVGVMEEHDISEFYKKIKKICMNISNSQINSQDLALAQLLNQGAEDNFNKTKEFVASKEDVKESKDDIIQCLRKLQRDLSNNSKEYSNENDLQLAVSEQDSLENTPFKFLDGSEKIQYVKDIISKLREHEWIHICGKMFTGKTQTLIRIAEKVCYYSWVTIKENEFVNMRVERLKLNDGSILILDGIPNIANRKFVANV